MQAGQIYNQITDIPGNFQPGGLTYQNILTSFLAGMSFLGITTDSLANQMSLPTATGNWLNVWALLLSLPNLSTFPTSQVAAMLEGLLTARTSTPDAILGFLQEFIDPTTTLVENANCSFTLSFHTPMTSNQLLLAVELLGRIRPAGVPFLPIYTVKVGVYLDANSYMNMNFSPSTFLTNSLQASYPALSASTTSLISQLPVEFLNFPVSVASL